MDGFYCTIRNVVIKQKPANSSVPGSGLKPAEGQLWCETEMLQCPLSATQVTSQ